jgi:hypothetical protein
VNRECLYFKPFFADEKRLRRAHSFVGKIESVERRLNMLEFCECAEVLGADAADLLKSVVKAKG